VSRKEVEFGRTKKGKMKGNLKGKSKPKTKSKANTKVRTEQNSQIIGLHLTGEYSLIPVPKLEEIIRGIIRHELDKTTIRFGPEFWERFSRQFNEFNSVTPEEIGLKPE
jgi:hypothetical protein